MEKIGILTGGGDCPGLNAVIRAVVRRSHALGYDVLGIRNGWAGLINGHVEPLTDFSVVGILPRGGTILGTSRTNPLKQVEHFQKLRSNWQRYGLNYLVAVGGEDTLGVAHKLFTQEGYPIVGVPKTIDNDLAGTDYTFGFDTAVQIVTEAIDRLHTTAESHKRVMVVEVMGRHAGWIATHSGMAGGADCILVPERRFSLDEVCALIRKRIERGREFAIVVVAEGAAPDEGSPPITKSGHVDEFGHPQLGGVGDWLGRQIEQRMGIETRVTVLGHVQRGGTPTAYDRVLATRFGLKAIELIREKHFGYMASLRGTDIVAVPIEDALTPKLLDPKVFDDASVFFG
ncbi:MAG: 6-phosphofructokinase [Acidobacteria bacterium]|nr:MAG: 6-phosphofructokinase [Acidobacteriota bacterium]